jgi:DNA (cytosine-5)-methyltransferase 1
MKTQLNELALFAGAGGGILGGHLLGWRTICAVEWDAYAASVLVARQNDGCLPPFPIWDDVQTFDGRPWRGRVDVVSGGFPCQDISCAGKGAGIEGEKSSMWKHMARIIGEVLPRFVFVENSPMLVGRGLTTVLRDLAEMGYDAEWGVVGAHHVSAPHKRDRIWILATDSNVCRCDDGSDTKRQYEVNHSQVGTHEKDQQSGSVGQHWTSEDCGDVADTKCAGLEGFDISKQPKRIGERTPSNTWEDGSQSDVSNALCERQQRQGQSWFGSDPAEKREGETDHAFSERVGHIWGIESPVGRVAYGVASRVDRLKAIGNGQVPAVAELAWETLKP